MRHVRIGLTLALALYAIAMLAAPETAVLVEAINAPVHETGHLMLAPFGGTLELLGGTILQLILPLLFGAWFTVQNDEHGASVAAWWVGQSFTSIGLAMANSSAIALSAPGIDRDWSHLFAKWGVMGQALQYGQLAHGFGFLVMLVATFWGVSDTLSAVMGGRSSPPRYRSVARR